MSQQPESTPRKRGFAAMDPEKVRAIASKGGKAAHVSGTAHQFTSDEAREAGKKGGTAPHVKRGRGPRKPSTLSEVFEAEDRQEKLPEVT